MNAYGAISVKATLYYEKGSPSLIWKEIAKEYFPDSTTSANKSCPKGAYLGLCEAGCVRGIPKGQYTRSKKSKQYALDGFYLIKNNPSLADDTDGLWKLIQNRCETPNGQMHVVCALFHAGLLNI